MIPFNALDYAYVADSVAGSSIPCQCCFRDSRCFFGTLIRNSLLDECILNKIER